MARHPRSFDDDWDNDLSHDDEFDGGYAAYVPVSAHRERAQAMARELERQGEVLEPVSTKAKSIATSVWGQAWNRNLELYSDYKTRLPHGRSYLRNGYVLDLKVYPGRLTAKVHGAELYELGIQIAPLEPSRWDRLLERCHGQIESLLDLLQGKLSDAVMAVMTDPDTGLFPQPHEIKFSCNCLDWADLCKHSAAVLYGVGARLDRQPELLFTLRGVDHGDLVASAAASQQLAGDGNLTGVDLGDLFGLDLEGDA